MAFKIGHMPFSKAASTEFLSLKALKGGLTAGTYRYTEQPPAMGKTSQIDCKPNFFPAVGMQSAQKMGRQQTAEGIQAQCSLDIHASSFVHPKNAFNSNNAIALTHEGQQPKEFHVTHEKHLLGILT